MSTQNHIASGWTELKSKVKEAWNQLNDDELRAFEGNIDQLIGWLQQKTGQSQQEVKQCLAKLDQQFRPMLQQFADTAREYYNQTVNATSDTVDRVREEVANRHAQAEDIVRHRPMESVAVAFGTGLIAGVIVGLIIRSK